jgi:hypothetical protein
MQSKIFYTGGFVNYYLVVLHDPDDYVPKQIAEDEDGFIYDFNQDRRWDSLPSMTQDLRVEIIGCETVDS